LVQPFFGFFMHDARSFIEFFQAFINVLPKYNSAIISETVMSSRNSSIILMTHFLFHKKKTCAKRKTTRRFLVKVFTEGKKVVGKAFLPKKRFLVKIRVILWF